eukprot:5319199-Pyramimonas_sp.AAC.1
MAAMAEKVSLRVSLECTSGLLSAPLPFLAQEDPRTLARWYGWQRRTTTACSSVSAQTGASS